MTGKLNALKVKRLSAPGRYGDGAGLWLQVRDAEHRSWLFRYTFARRPREMGLGPERDVTLAEARELARDMRRLIRDGVDPIERRRGAKAEEVGQAVTFRQVCDHYLAAYEQTWRNEKHRYQWRQTLDLACAKFGARPVGAIKTGDVTAVLEPIWREKPETASRLRGRIEAVLDYAKARSWRTGENPARWRGHLSNLLPAPSKVAKVEHHAALPWSKIGQFMKQVRAEEGVSARALEFTILTAARTGEVIGATWAEFDLDAAIWTVPGDRMKAGRDHRVPLSDPALAVLRAMNPDMREPAEHVFPGGKAGKPLSNMAMAMLLRRMDAGDLTVHGMRSAFRDWAAEATNYPREVAEQALAHTLADKVEAAYRRSDLLEKRRRLMADWATFCGRPTTAGGEVVPIRAATA